MVKLPGVMLFAKLLVVIVLIFKKSLRKSVPSAPEKRDSKQALNLKASEIFTASRASNRRIISISHSMLRTCTITNYWLLIKESVLNSFIRHNELVR